MRRISLAVNNKLGLVYIFSIARHGVWKNEIQVNLLKVLGADFHGIQVITLTFLSNTFGRGEI